MTGTFSLEELADCYRIHGVPVRDSTYAVDIAKNLLDGGAKKRQNDWIAYSQRAIKNDDFIVGSSMLYHGVFTVLYDHRDDVDHKENVEKIRIFSQSAFRHKHFSTLSKVIYVPNRKDKVVHNVRMQDQYVVEGRFIGSNEDLNNSKKSSDAYTMMFGKDPDQINDVFKWISGWDTYFWRHLWIDQERSEEIIFGHEGGFCVIADGSRDRYYTAEDDYELVGRFALGVRARLISPKGAS